MGEETVDTEVAMGEETGDMGGAIVGTEVMEEEVVDIKAHSNLKITCFSSLGSLRACLSFRVWNPWSQCILTYDCQFSTYMMFVLLALCLGCLSSVAAFSCSRCLSLSQAKRTIEPWS